MCICYVNTTKMNNILTWTLKKKNKSTSSCRQVLLPFDISGQIIALFYDEVYGSAGGIQSQHASSGAYCNLVNTAHPTILLSV